MTTKYSWGTSKPTKEIMKTKKQQQDENTNWLVGSLVTIIIAGMAGIGFGGSLGYFFGATAAMYIFALLVLAMKKKK